MASPNSYQFQFFEIGAILVTFKKEMKDKDSPNISIFWNWGNPNSIQSKQS